MFYLMIYFFSFLVILYLFKFLNKINLYPLRFQLIIFGVIYVAFCWAFTPSFNLFLWFAMVPLIYALLEDCLTSEFDFRFPLVSSLLLLFISFDWYILLFSLVIFSLLLLFTHLKFLSNGEPYLILPFLFIVPTELWFNFFFLSCIAGASFLLIYYLLTKKKSVAFSYFLFATYTFYLYFYTL